MSGRIAEATKEQSTDGVQLPATHQYLGSAVNTYAEDLLMACGIAVAAYMGAYIRVGFGYYKIW